MAWRNAPSLGPRRTPENTSGSSQNPDTRGLGVSRMRPFRRMTKQSSLLAHDRWFLLGRRKVALNSAAISLAFSRYRACCTQGVARQAHGRAELHHGLIPTAGVAPGQQLGRYRSDIGASVTCEAHDHAAHIPVNGSMRQPESDARDRGGRVIADASEFADRRVVAREAAGLDHLAGGLLHVARARVVSQAAPEREKLGLGRPREILDAREALQEAFVVRDHRRLHASVAA